MINLPERLTYLDQPPPSLPELALGTAPPLGSLPTHALDPHAWWCRVVGLPEDQVKIRVRGNNLYVLCEAIQCPDQTRLRSRVIRALLRTNLDRLLAAHDHPEIYQITLYGKPIAAVKPTWARVIYLNQLQAYAKQHPNRKRTATPSQGRGSSNAEPTPNEEPTTAVLAVSNRYLAQQGQPAAIARHLSEFLSSQGIAVRAGMKALIQHGEELPLRRLVIFCEAAYSPDPAFLIEPIAQRLRELALTTFRDAVVYGQVQGEATPEWKLRIDLTPPDEMLREWARWGDLEAILQLVNQAIAPHQLEASGIVLDMILHLTCWRTARSGHEAFDAPPQQVTVREIVALMEQVAPQGIHAACLYGANTVFRQPTPQLLSPDHPAWTHRFVLPASAQPGLSDTTEHLAVRGEINAISFLLTRLLNPELAQKLATGGLRIQARHRHDLVHVMVDGPTLPTEKTVVPLITDYLQSLHISGVNGLRMYGRRAGEQHPRWREAVDFVSRDRLVPEATPEFAASEAYVGDLITQQTGALLVRPELSADQLRQLLAHWLDRLRQVLIGSQMFTPVSTARSITKPAISLDRAWFQDAKVAMVWGSMGILVTLCADWGLGLLVPAPTQSGQSRHKTAQELSLAGIPLHKSATASDAFNGDSFTGKDRVTGKDQRVTAMNRGLTQDQGTIGTNGKPLIAAPIQPRAIIDPELKPYGAFNTPQLNDKVALYEQFVAQSGVPDILIVGSSRALRGVDPVALQESLAAQGYSGRKIFNFGVNGATAQVVDLILRRLIAPDKLPKIIIWADGARALNSGRLDVTYNAIATSPGYAALPTEPENRHQPAVSLEDLSNRASLLATRYQAWNTQLNQWVAKGSSVYEQRTSLVNRLRDQTIGRIFPKPISETETIANVAGEANLDAIDVNGFLPLAVRFNPTTYYQKYARVSGLNDADYTAFQLQGRQTDALKSAATYVKTKGASLIFVNLPTTAEYLDADRRSHEDTFQQFMIQRSAIDGFTYRNLGDSLKTNVDYFSDPSHLNRYGAHGVSQLLAQDPLIPWGAQ